MGMIPPEALEAIRARLDIGELVREYLPELKRAGRNLKARCPFHQERTPSFVVSPDRQSFHCFGCGEGGDVFAFVMKIESLSFGEAAEKLAEKAGVKIAPARESLGPAERERLKLKEALEFAAKHYHEALLKSPEAAAARSYLAQRGVSAGSIEAFQLGFAPARSGLLGLAARQGFPAEVMLGAGLAAKREGGVREYFFNRILYPIRDARGTTVGFGARAMGDAQPKYLNSPETAVFSKGRVLYGLYHGLAQVRKARKLWLMEGYMDVIATHQHGLPYACAPLGTALTPEQATLVKRYADEVTVVFDADSAGQSAAARGAEILLAQGLLVRIATVPGGKDPDEVLQKSGTKPFEECLAQAVDLPEFKTELAISRLGGKLGPEQKAAVAREVLAVIGQCPDEVLKAEWAKRLAQRLQTSEEALLKQLAGKAVSSARPLAGRAQPSPPPRGGEVAVGGGKSVSEPLSRSDEQLLSLALRSPELLAQLLETDLESGSARRIRGAALGLSEGSAAGWSARLLESLAPGDRSLASRLLVDDKPDEKPEATLKAVLERRRREKRLAELEPLIFGAADVDAGLREEYRRLNVEQKGSRR